MIRYTLDPEQISIKRFYSLTCRKKMIPSRRVLQEGIEKHFRALETMNLRTVRDLLRATGNKEKIATLARESGIAEDYLTLLKREAGSYLARPFPLSDLPAIPLEYTEVLKTKSIRSTRDFFESVQSPEQKKHLAKQTGIPLARLDEIYALCDLSRITGVGSYYARIVYLAGIRSVHEYAKTNVQAHKKLYLETLEKYNYPVQALSEDDLQYCIDYAILIEELN